MRRIGQPLIIMSLKTVDLSNKDVAGRIENLPEGYELYSVIDGAINLVVVDNRASMIFTTHKSVYSYNTNGKVNKDGEICLFPSKDIRDWSMFYAPAKDEVVRYITAVCGEVWHIAGKWFYHADGRFIDGEPIYIGDGLEEPISQDKISSVLSDICQDVGLTLDQDTLEWSEVEIEQDSKQDTAKEEIILSDGSVAYEGDEVITCCGGIWAYPSNLKHKSDTGQFVTTNKFYNEWECSLLLEGNADLSGQRFQPWHLGKKWPCGLRTGQPCLGRNYDDQEWTFLIFSHERRNTYCASSVYWNSILPYQGNEHLVGTRDAPRKEYK